MQRMLEYKIYQGVHLGEHAEIGPFVLIGVPPRGSDEGQIDTVVGSHAIIRSHTVIYAGNLIGDYFQTGHGAMIRENNRIGREVSVGTSSVIEHHVSIGDRVRIHSNAFIPEFSILESDCWVGPNVVLTNAKYPRSAHVKENLKGPTIRSGAKVGANATLLPGVEIGAHSLVGAGSVVTKDVPSHAIVAGNPARVVRYISDLSY